MATSSDTYPLIAFNSSNDSDWLFPIEKGSVLPTDFLPSGTFFEITFTAVQCSGAGDTAKCTAVGSYETSNGVQYPLIANSVNGGQNWSYPVEKGSKLPKGFVSDGRFTDLSCIGLRCIAVGDYNNVTTSSIPMIALSLDGG
ncbi:MAG: hypothetical protein PSV35_05025, partial [bacterium]|nr:hypothetical protein [bacterium]